MTTLPRTIAGYVIESIAKGFAGRLAMGTVVTSPYANTTDPFTVQVDGSGLAVPVKLIRANPVFPGMQVALIKIHTQWICIGSFSNPAVGTGASRVVLGADVPQELRDAFDIETCMLFYAVDAETGLEAGYFFAGVSNLYNNESPTLLRGEVRYPTLGDPSSPTTSNVKPNQQSIMMDNLIPVDTFFNVQIASIGGFFLQDGARFGVIDGLTGTSADVFDIEKPSGVATATLSDGASWRMPNHRRARTASKSLRTTTLEDDGVLEFTPKVSTRYGVDMFLMWLSTTTADIKMTLSVPASTQYNLVASTFSRAAGAGARLVDTQMISQGETMVIPGQGTTFNTQSQWTVITGQISVAATAGDVALQWAQNALDAANDTTMVLNSWASFTEMN